jgi:hypothetical protein
MPSPVADHKTLIGGIIIVMLVIPAFLPARWFGVTPKHIDSHVILDLQALQKASTLSEDTDKNGSTDWVDLLKESGLTLDSASGTTPTTNSASDAASIARAEDPNNITTSFARNALTIAAYIKQNNITDPIIQQGLIEQAVADETSKVITPTYTATDLKEVADSKENQRTYGNTLGKAAKKVLIDGSKYSELQALKDYQDKKSSASLATIRAKYAIVKTFRDTLRSMPVPTSAIIYHLIALKQVEVYLVTIDNMSMVESDPLRASFALTTYTDTLQKALNLINPFSQYFDTQNIVFTSQEPGYIFTSGILIK